MQTILISTRTSGPHKIDAQIVGPFAIHATPRGNKSGRGTRYTVTHLFTGMAVVHNLMDTFTAALIAEKLGALDNWYFGWIDMADEPTARASCAESLAWLKQRGYR